MSLLKHIRLSFLGTRLVLGLLLPPLLLSSCKSDDEPATTPVDVPTETLNVDIILPADV
jgi:hypothetical protein